MSFNYDSKSTTSLSKDSRNTAGTLTNDSKATGGNLWTASVFPWTLTFPWGSGVSLSLDIKN